MKLYSNKSIIVTSGILLFVIIIVALLIHSQKDSPTIEQVFGEAFIEGEPKNIDQLIALSDHVVLGTVIEILDNVNDEEYVVQIKKQFKGKTESEQIHVYENKGALSANQTYVLFLNVTKNAYIPHLTYTSPMKDTILAIEEGQVNHRSSLFAPNITWTQLELILTHSPGNDIIATTDITRGHADIEKDPLPLHELMEKANLIAHVVVKEKSLGNKYAQLVKFDFEHIYKNNSKIEIDHLTPFIMPSTLELNEEYIVFLQFHDGAFYTVSLQESTIPKNDEHKWNEALEKLKWSD